MSVQAIRLSPVVRLDVRISALHGHTIYLVGSIILLAMVGVNGQYEANNNYQYGYNIADVGGGGVNYYDLVGPEVDQAELNGLSGYESQGREAQARESLAKDWLVSSLLERWLTLQGRPLSEAEQGVDQQADSDVMTGIESGDLMKRRSGSEDTDRDELFYYYDANAHLPANSPYGLAPSSDTGDQLSGPVNNPEEFEAKLGQLTDALNHKMSNTQARERLLLSMLNSTNAGGRQRPVADLQLQVMADDQTLGELQHDDLVHELGEYLQLKLAELKGQQSGDRADENQRLDEVSLGSDNDLDKSFSSPGYFSDDSDLNESSRSFASSTPVSRYGGSEYIDHPLALVGHQYVQGGAGEGRQLLGPDGTFENVQVIKTDTAIPSYCDPPNPCPIGYTAKDGCLEEFVNSASFSREYQAKQKCSCDNEHSLFQCASPQTSGKSGVQGGEGNHESSSNRLSPEVDDDISANGGGDGDGDIQIHVNQLASALEGGKLNTLARTIQNRFGDLASVRKLIGEQQERQSAARNAQDSPRDANNYLVRSARKWSPEINLHKTQLD